MNKKVFLTGACGYIGTRLLEALVGREEPVRALSRRPELKPEPPPGLGWTGGGPLASPLVEWVRGDVADRDSLLRAMEGCSQVYHLAAYAKNWARDPQTSFAVNVQGMRNVFDAAAQLGVQRVVWTSTCLTLGPSPPGGVVDEDTPRRTGRHFVEYERTKCIAEAEAFARAREGFPVVIVNPNRVYGPGYLNEANSATLLIDRYDRGKLPMLPNRGVNVGNWVLVDDVVQGHLLAMEKGRIGQRYVLGGENASLARLLALVDLVSGKRHFKIPMLRITPMVFAYLQQIRARWLGVYPQITPGWARLYMTDWAQSSQKAERELGYRPTPLAEGLRLTYAWLQRVRQERS